MSKGSQYRPVNWEKYSKNFDKIFGVKDKKSEKVIKQVEYLQKNDNPRSN